MPLYEYQCFVCNSRFERIQKVSDDIISDCPSCGGGVRRLLGVPALQFKGSGWYVTDYGKGNGKGSGNGKGKTNGKSHPAGERPAETAAGDSAKKETGGTTAATGSSSSSPNSDSGNAASQTT